MIILTTERIIMVIRINGTITSCKIIINCIVHKFDHRVNSSYIPGLSCTAASFLTSTSCSLVDSPHTS